MKPLSQLIKDLRQEQPGKSPPRLDVNWSSRFPYIYLRIANEVFATGEIEDRVQWLADWLGWTRVEIEETTFHSNVQLRLQTKQQQSAEPALEGGDSWLREILTDETQGAYSPKRELAEGPIQTLHFYGYKGGQGRSTCLAFVAQALAKDGYRVLVVDADLEAPSLHILLGVKPVLAEQTLLGVSADLTIEPLSVFRDLGALDLLACSPEGSAYTFEAVTLAMRCGMDPKWIHRCAQRLKALQQQKEHGYDLILIDHRTGSSPFCLPWMHALPGPVLLFARLDNQWQMAKPFFPALFRVYPPNPGLLISFADRSISPETARYENGEEIAQLLGIMQRAIHRQKEPAPYLGPDHLVIWPYDANVRRTNYAEAQRTPTPLQDAVHEVRRLLGIAQPKDRAPSPRGSLTDSNTLLLPVMRQVLAAQSPIRYIVGRKGTGKTCLFRAMQDPQHSLRKHLDILNGAPLLVDDGPTSEENHLSNDEAQGFNVRESGQLRRIADGFSPSPQTFWWVLFACALSRPDTNRKGLNDALAEVSERINSLALAEQEFARAVQQAASASAKRRLFLLDALEFIFTPAAAPEFISALFSVLIEIQRSPTASEQLDVRLFLRPDQLPSNLPNPEQFFAGQVGYLRWDLPVALNFLLSRIAVSSFFQDRIPVVMEELRQATTQQHLLRGELDVPTCDRLLLKIFPPDLLLDDSRVPLGTFFRLFFTDSALPSSAYLPGFQTVSRPTYYPRVLSGFIDAFASYTPVPAKKEPISAEQMRHAYHKAAEIFRQQITLEIDSFMSKAMGFSLEENHWGTQLLEVLRGMVTPFKFTKEQDKRETASRLYRKLHSSARNAAFDVELVEKAMEELRKLGVFEQDGLQPDYWRASPLVQHALQLKNA